MTTTVPGRWYMSSKNVLFVGCIQQWYSQNDPKYFLINHLLKVNMVTKLEAGEHGPWMGLRGSLSPPESVRHHVQLWQRRVKIT